MTDQGLRILLAAPRGFCAGVDRAIEIVEKALEIFGEPIYVKHEIVHNKHVVDRLRRKGVIFVEEVHEIPDRATAIFSAHGVSKAVRAEAAARPMRVIDATCPLVTKVHLEVHRLDMLNYDILLIGHAGHVEVEGTMGQLPPGRIRLVQSPAEAERIVVADPSKVSYVTQTTLSLDETEGIVAVLRRRFPQMTAPSKDDICYATQNRQNAIKAMIPQIDLLLVIGSRNSSNSNRLVEVARSHGIKAFLFDEPEEMEESWFENVKTVGLTAGASAPEDLVQATVNTLISRYGGRAEPFLIKEEHVVFGLPKELVTSSSSAIPLRETSFPSH
jgi:4-hydroxy-3-methylbut-2-enyl diphosphate reductase